MKYPRTTFITWYPYCRRSDAIADKLGGISHLVHYLGFKRPLHAPFKYVLQTVKTLSILRREKPDLVIVAVPPIFAALPVWLAARIAGKRFVIDAHTGIFTYGRWKWFLPLTRRAFRAADAVIVTSDHLANLVRSWGATPVVVGDVPVTFVEGIQPDPTDRPRVIVVNTFSPDEPVEEVLNAARSLADVDFYVTGDKAHAKPEWLSHGSENVTFTGFVSEEAYAGLVRAADVMVVLTTHDHTMQRGGYEAMALAKPLVTSDWEILRQTFSRGTVHVDNSAEGIAQGIRQALAWREQLATEMAVLREERKRSFKVRLDDLMRLTQDGAATPMERALESEIQCSEGKAT